MVLEKTATVRERNCENWVKVFQFEGPGKRFEDWEIENCDGSLLARAWDFGEGIQVGVGAKDEKSTKNIGEERTRR